MVDELFSKLKSSEVDRGLRDKSKNPTDSHSLALVSSRGDTACLLYTSPSPRDATLSRMPSSA